MCSLLVNAKDLLLSINGKSYSSMSTVKEIGPIGELIKE